MTDDQIKQRISEIDDQIEKLQSEERTLSMELAKRVSKFKVGDFIKWITHSWGESRKEHRGRVLAIGRNDRWLVQRIRKDGTDGARVSVSKYDKPELTTLP